MPSGGALGAHWSASGGRREAGHRGDVRGTRGSAGNTGTRETREAVPRPGRYRPSTPRAQRRPHDHLGTARIRHRRRERFRGRRGEGGTARPRAVRPVHDKALEERTRAWYGLQAAFGTSSPSVRGTRATGAGRRLGRRPSTPAAPSSGTTGNRPRRRRPGRRTSAGRVPLPEGRSPPRSPCPVTRRAAGSRPCCARTPSPPRPPPRRGRQGRGVQRDDERRHRRRTREGRGSGLGPAEHHPPTRQRRRPGDPGHPLHRPRRRRTHPGVGLGDALASGYGPAPAGAALITAAGPLAALAIPARGRGPRALQPPSRR